jgi:hypothetical protein
MTAIFQDAPDLSTAVKVTIKAAPDGAAAFIAPQRAEGEHSWSGTTSRPSCW